MKTEMITKILRIVQTILSIFLSLTAIAGCIQLLEGTYAPSTTFLKGSLFGDYTIPGLALGLVVGGSAALAAVLLIRKNRYGFLTALAAGTAIMFFEFVEVMVIGAPDLTAKALQIFYFGLGTLILVVSTGVWFLALQTNS
jgi:hypothetical protein